jgi:hypothetical protein
MCRNDLIICHQNTPHKVYCVDIQCLKYHGYLKVIWLS